MQPGFMQNSHCTKNLDHQPEYSHNHSLGHRFLLFLFTLGLRTLYEKRRAPAIQIGRRFRFKFLVSRNAAVNLITTVFRSGQGSSVHCGTKLHSFLAPEQQTSEAQEYFCGADF